MTALIGSTSIPAYLSALDYAREGIDNGVRSFDQVAQKVAGATGYPAAISADNQVAALNALNQFAAATNVFKTGDEILGTLLNLRA